jgi:N-terminal half of MaoC dehydratase
MYIDRDKALKFNIASMPFEVERGRLRFFARTIGLTDPIYFDLDAAKRAGHRDLPVPPTFLGNSLELELPNPLGWLSNLGGDLMKTTHAEQAFTYHALAYANDHLVLHRRIVDVYTKKGGALEFVVKQTDVKRGDQTLAEILFVIALRHPEAQHERP